MFSAFWRCSFLLFIGVIAFIRKNSQHRCVTFGDTPVQLSSVSHPLELLHVGVRSLLFAACAGWGQRWDPVLSAFLAVWLQCLCQYPFLWLNSYIDEFGFVAHLSGLVSFLKQFLLLYFV